MPTLRAGWAHTRGFLLLLVLFLSGCGAAAVATASAPEAPAGYAYEGETGAVPAEASAEASQDIDKRVALKLMRGSSSVQNAPAGPTRPTRTPATPPRIQGATPAPPPPPSPRLALQAPREKDAPLLIYSATISMAVFGTAQALRDVEELARSRKGYLVKRSDSSITIRVPAALFDETLEGVSGLGDELHRDVSARDVTEEFTDLEVRLRNAEVVRQRLEALLAKAGSVEDALAVERELARVTESIELYKGKLELLRELVAFSTITVNFRARPTERVNSDVPLPFEWLNQLGLPNLLSL
jgi:hypothetical protein